MIQVRNYINIEKGTNREINKDIRIENGVVFLKNGTAEYKYQYDCWYIKAGENWVNMQGGVPIYEINENIDEQIFETIENEQGE